MPKKKKEEESKHVGWVVIGHYYTDAYSPITADAIVDRGDVLPVILDLTPIKPTDPHLSVDDPKSKGSNGALNCVICGKSEDDKIHSGFGWINDSALKLVRHLEKLSKEEKAELLTWFNNDSSLERLIGALKS